MPARWTTARWRTWNVMLSSVEGYATHDRMDEDNGRSESAGPRGLMALAMPSPEASCHRVQDRVVRRF